ncbi:MAG: hypothetical protein DRQ88_03430 [Epsilonproteobacteria bacterium]|nr:MAG: hypothetical protein DRQ89_01330 [Campylobacterota bacterium]RLA67371.1 MAG: hypothetical protein DRQ88_03430 [Campylobacterota bacterium]
MQKFILGLVFFSLPLFGGMNLPLKFKLDKTFEMNNDFIKKVYIEGTIMAYLPEEFSSGVLNVEPFSLNSWVTWHDDQEFDLSLSAEPVIYYEATDICDLEIIDFKLNVTDVSSDLLPTKWLLKKVKKLARKFDNGKFLSDKKETLIKLGNEKFKEFRKDACDED